MCKSVEIHASVGKIILLIAGGIGFVIAGFTLIRETDVVGAIAGIAAIVFFGLASVIGLWRLVTLRGPVVTVGPDGFRDIRIAPETVGWNEISDISERQFGGQKFVVLKVPDETWDRLSLTTIAARSRRANRALGADGLAIASTELKTNHRELLRLTNECWNDSRHRQN